MPRKRRERGHPLDSAFRCAESPADRPGPPARLAVAAAEGRVRPGGPRRRPRRADRRRHRRQGRPRRGDGRTQPDGRHLRQLRLHAEQVAAPRRAGGVPGQGRAKVWLRAPGRPPVDFAAVMIRVREMRAFSGSFDAVSVAAGAGIDVFLGDGRFVGRDAVEVDGQRLRFRKALIATGSGPAVPDLPGLAAAAYLTNETVFELTELPRRVVCVGAGIVNCELAQALRRLGSEVDLVGSGDRLLPSEAPAASELLAGRLAAEGVRLRLGQRVTSVDGGQRRAVLGDGTELPYDALLLATGRRVRVDGLGLESAGVKFRPSGVETDDCLRTANPAVYAAGDVAQPEKYTHAAIATAKLAVTNALDGAGKRVSELVIPHCTYTDPEVAQVGVTPQEAQRRGMAIQTHRMELSKVERAVIDGSADGFAALYTHQGRLVGATYVAAHAGESVPLLALAVAQRMTPGELAAVIHCYPTQVEAIQRAAAQPAD